MPVALPRTRAAVFLLALAAGFVFAVMAAPSAMASYGGGVLYTQTNDPAGNTVQRFDRAADGSLTPAGTFRPAVSGFPASAAVRAPSSSAATGATCHRGTLVVSEAGASSVSSYRTRHAGTLRSITAALPVGQGAACWVAVSPSGRFAYTGNASGSISGFAIAADGALTALDSDGLAAGPLPSPRDLDFDRSGRFLYVVSPGTAAAGELVTTYRVADGSLSVVGTTPAAAGLTGAAAS